MPKFAAGLIFFNDAASLKRCMPSLKPFDYVFAIDGKYDTFEYHSDLSDDGSREVVKEYPNTILIDKPNLKEFQKRQVYFDISEQYGVDYLIIVDSDEYMHGDWELFTKTWIKRMEQKPHHLNVAPVQWAGNPSHWQNIPICVYRPYEVEYRLTHWSHALKTAPMGEWLNHPAEKVGWTDGIRFYHDHTLRKKDYMKRRENFELKQAKYEAGVNLFTGENKEQAIRKIQRELKQDRSWNSSP